MLFNFCCSCGFLLTDSLPFTDLFDDEGAGFFIGKLGLLEGFLTSGFEVAGGFFDDADF